MRFRGWVAGALLLVLAGCGNPGGVDGDLTDGWGAIQAPTGFTPEPGACHLANFSNVGTRAAYEEVDCDLKHRTETVFVGKYADPAAQAAAPPADDSAAARGAYQTCDAKTSAYVAAPWRTGRFWIGVTHPSPAAWTGGARWFRCEVLEISSIEDDGGLVMRLGTVKDALKASGSDLLLGCYAIQLDSNGAISTMPAASCGARHNAEFVGVWDADDLDYPKDDKQWAKFHEGCRKLIASFAKVPDDADLQYRTGVVSLPGGEDVWRLGDHGVRCYMWLDGAELTKSLKGVGIKELPVQYK
ncbi:septum formation family protein [Actinoplanes sp. NPDC049265]|uniref:septum formation family protein n=1 Tax=Actinoplanes sp. NPDC049265 TaxID=3363902 RepID=UPI00371CA105